MHVHSKLLPAARLQRTNDPDDGRAHPITITDSGFTASFEKAVITLVASLGKSTSRQSLASAGSHSDSDPEDIAHNLAAAAAALEHLHDASRESLLHPPSVLASAASSPSARSSSSFLQRPSASPSAPSSARSRSPGPDDGGPLSKKPRYGVDDQRSLSPDVQLEPTRNKDRASSAGSSRRRQKKRREQRGQDEGAWSRKHTALYERSRPLSLVALDEMGDIEYHVADTGFRSNPYMDGLLSEVPTLEEATKYFGFDELEWDGRRTILLLDEEQRILVVLMGGPAENDERSESATWQATCQRVADLFERLRVQYPDAFADSAKNRRGKYAALNFGISFGGGQKKAGLLRQENVRHAIVEEICRDTDVRRLAGFQSEGFASFFPKAYHHHRLKMRRLSMKRTSSTLQPPFDNSVYPTACANMGPQTVCVEHADNTNYPGTPCTVTALGDFDSELGGHFILYSFKLCVRFPAGSTIWLSSAGIPHGNVAIQEDERRYSFTQYCVGGLMSWITNGLKRVKSLRPKKRTELDEAAKEGWREQLARFSKVSELADDRKWLREQEALPVQSKVQSAA